MLSLLELLLVSQRTEGLKIRGSMNHRLTGMFTSKAVAIPSSTVYASVLIVAVVLLYFPSGVSLMLDVTDFKSPTS